MKKVLLVYIIIIAAALVSCRGENPAEAGVQELDIPCDTPVNIPDAVVASSVRNTLENMGLPKGATICRAHMALITTLRIYGNLATNTVPEDLEGLQYCTNLTHLEVINTRVHDLTPILGLDQLETLNVSHGSVANFDGLSNLTSLTTLILADNKFDTRIPIAAPDDLSELNSLVNLRVLNLSGNNIYDISPLNTLNQLEVLYVEDCRLNTINVVSNYHNLRELDIISNYITDISPVSGLTNLEFLAMEKNYDLTDISAVSGLVNLEDLSFGNCNVSDIGPVASNAGLDTGDEVHTCDNPLDNTSINTHIPNLRARGVIVYETYSFTDAMGVTHIECGGF